MKKNIPTLIILVLLVGTFFFWRGGSRWVLDFNHRDQNVDLTISNAEVVPNGVTLIIPSKQKLTFKPDTVEVGGMSDHLPIGAITFADTTTLPGRVILQIEDNEIDIMKRALIINGVEYHWRGIQELDLSAVNSTP